MLDVLERRIHPVSSFVIGPVKVFGISAATLGGIGFSVALFIAGLAFEDADLLAEAKIGILVGPSSPVCSGLGSSPRNDEAARQRYARGQRDASARQRR